MKKLEADILKILEEDCRYSPSKIAVMLDTSEAEVSAAIKNMEESGVIVKYTAIVNGEACRKRSCRRSSKCASRRRR